MKQTVAKQEAVDNDVLDSPYRMKRLTKSWILEMKSNGDLGRVSWKTMTLDFCAVKDEQTVQGCAMGRWADPTLCSVV